MFYSYNIRVLVFSPLVLSGAALWATIITWSIDNGNGCKDMQGFYVIVTVLKAFQGLISKCNYAHNTGLAMKIEVAAITNHATNLAAINVAPALLLPTMPPSLLLPVNATLLLSVVRITLKNWSY